MKILFEVEDKTYCAHLSHGYLTINGRDRRTSECTITTTNPIEIYSGITMKNPNDGMDYDELYGYRLAFKRALFQMFVIRNLKKGGKIYSIEYWEHFKNKFRVPFGKALHEYMGQDIPF